MTTDLSTKQSGSALISPAERGARLKKIREYMGLSRKYLFERFGVPPGTLQNWEEARYGGLSEKGAQKIIGIYQQVGIHVSLEWLLYGAGTAPVFNNGMSPKNFSHSEPAVQQIAQELQFFHQLNPGAVDAIVQDQSMNPALMIGDIVAGIRYFHPNLQNALGKVCIIQLLQGDQLIRVLQESKNPGHYRLTTISGTAASHSHETWDLQENTDDLAIFSAAPICWIRRAF